MASAYAGHDVVLKLSRIEGMFGPPLEGFHCGATCVVTPVTGHDEYVAHGFNGLVTDWDDERGTARLLDLLARDRALLHELRLNAVRTARAWPSWSDQAHVMAAALRAIRREPPPRAFAGAVELLGDVGAAVEHTRRAIEERDRLRYRVAPLVALERALERRQHRQRAFAERQHLGEGVAQVVVQPTRRVARTLKTDADLDATVRDAQGSEVFENRLRGAHSGAANASAAGHLACESHQISEDGLGEVGGLRVRLGEFALPDEPAGGLRRIAVAVEEHRLPDATQPGHEQVPSGVRIAEQVLKSLELRLPAAQVGRVEAHPRPVGAQPVISN